MPGQTIDIPQYYIDWEEAASAAAGSKKVKKARNAGHNFSPAQIPGIVRGKTF